MHAAFTYNPLVQDHMKPGPQPADIFGGTKMFVTCCWTIFGGEKWFWLLLHLTTKHVFENFAGGITRLPPHLVAGLHEACTFPTPLQTFQWYLEDSTCVMETIFVWLVSRVPNNRYRLPMLLSTEVVIVNSVGLALSSESKWKQT